MNISPIYKPVLPQFISGIASCARDMQHEWSDSKNAKITLCNKCLPFVEAKSYQIKHFSLHQANNDINLAIYLRYCS